ncbi:uncharacterized protein LOC135407259 [Pseudopipra pipra]|uniref:uncharacterized protein LOC135407259 n=1 Tax=Pseudopipra pipra TaxID=415032 RepID=UPI003139B10F
MSSQLLQDNAVGNSAKGSTKVQVDNTHSLSLIHQAGHLVIEDQADQAGPAFRKSKLGLGWHGMALNTIPGTEGRAGTAPRGLSPVPELTCAPSSAPASAAAALPPPPPGRRAAPRPQGSEGAVRGEGRPRIRGSRAPSSPPPCPGSPAPHPRYEAPPASSSSPSPLPSTCLPSAASAPGPRLPPTLPAPSLTRCPRPVPPPPPSFPGGERGAHARPRRTRACSGGRAQARGRASPHPGIAHLRGHGGPEPQMEWVSREILLESVTGSCQTTSVREC